MLFNSIEFILFFPIAFLGYYMIPERARYIWLLICSYYFYMCWNPIHILLLIFSTVTTYICGLLLDYIKKNILNSTKKNLYKKLCLTSCLVLNLGLLCYFKYMNFFIGYLLKICNKINIYPNISELDILLPVGISFFIFQVIGYIIDIYREEVYAEKNLFKYALFVSFFPQLVAGPIERSKNLLTQLNIPQKFNWHNLKKGILLILYGFFLKMVIADRIAILVNTVYSNPIQYPGLYIVIATIFFAIQIYCDFYGYSTIARGVALTMGIHLMDNFNAPYYAMNIQEFWQRWHISLSGWFRDYLYIPLGGNRKGPFRKQINRMIVFSVSGLWHGASLNYVVWGFLNGFYQVLADIRTKSKIKLLNYLHVTKSPILPKTSKILRQLLTFGLICFTWLFFRADGLSNALILLCSIRNSFNWWILFDESIFTLGIDIQYFRILMLSIIILFIVDYYKYNQKDICENFFHQKLWFQELSFIFLFTVVILFGCYGEMYDASEFIYFQF